MRTETPHRVYLKDYRPPEFLIDSVDLDIRLDADDTRVISTLSVRRNPEASAAGSPALVLDGENITLEEVAIDGVTLQEKAYVLSAKALTLNATPNAPFELRLVTRCAPAANTALSGLYQSSGTFCTQCEAEGFRRITFFLDRPDVLSVYTVRVTADKQAAPVLLSNGNLVESGDGEEPGTHYALWHDPHPKPCYLFALVGGNLACVEDSFTTMSGREVDLKIYVEPGREGRCGYAMEALKRAMRWDEERFGREYDLDIFMIVAVSDFNMGAMENKGLNIFNDKYILASSETATDADYANIEAIIAHEYFHNWTGNRITCRDWFQLCLKEGLTVFRDQEFSADVRSRPVERIGDVKMLRAHQFPEDSGPLAHPVRPNSFIEINNFYTATVYEKGAELVRMIHTIAGEEGFRAGMDLYFDRHDGEAATVEQFLVCFEEAAGIDLRQFRLWYSQAGTPELVVKTRFDAGQRSFTLDIEQVLPATPGQAKKEPMHIPIRLGLLDADGNDLPAASAQGGDDVIHLTKAQQSFRFDNISAPPVVSLLRGFSAPVRLRHEAANKDLLFQLAHDGDAFNRWQAAQSFAMRQLLSAYGAQTQEAQSGSAEDLARALARSVSDETLEPAYRALLLELPGETEIAQTLGSDVDTGRVRTVREQMRRTLAREMAGDLADIYERHALTGPYSPDSKASGSRALRNAALVLMTLNEGDAGGTRAAAHFEAADNMTDMMAALHAVNHTPSPHRQEMLDSFFARFEDDPLVLDKWFTLHAVSALPGTVEKVAELMSHPHFSLKTPNRVRALVGSFALANASGFHRADGAGYRLVADTVASLDEINPQVAARLLGTFKSWRIYDGQRREHAEKALRGISAIDGLSPDVAEIAASCLGSSA